MVHLHQIAGGVLNLAIGLLALAVWRRTVAADRRAAGWGVAGAYFTVTGVFSLPQALASWLAVRAGPQSGLYAWVVEWGTAANLGRAGVAVFLPALLALAISPLRRWVQRPVGTLLPFVATLAAVLTVAARTFGDGSVHQAMVVMAVLAAIAGVALMPVLLAALVYDAFDRLLWLSMAAFAFKETLNVSLLAMMTWWSVSPDPVAFWTFSWIMLVVTGAMAAMGARRLALARSGRRVPALFERARPLRRPALGWHRPT
jgi:hypothetical protein